MTGQDSTQIILSSDTARLEAVQYINSALQQDYRDPHACATSLVRALRQLGTPQQIDAFTMENQGTTDTMFEMWTSLYRFLVATRKEDEVHALVDYLSRCVMCNTHAFHESNEGDMTDETVGSFISYAFNAINAQIEIMKIKSLQPTPYKLWPHNLPQLLPVPPEDLLSTLLSWYRLFKRAEIMLSIGVLMHQGDLCVLFNMIRVDVTRKGIVEPMKAVVDQAHSQLMLTSPHVPVEPRSAAWNEAYGAFKSHTHPFGCYIDAVLRRGTHADALMKGTQLQALQLCTLICYAIDGYILAFENDTKEVETLKHIKHLVVCLGTRIFQTFFRVPREGYTFPLMFHHPDIANRYHAGGDAGVKCVQIAAAMTQIHMRTRCSNAKCDRARAPYTGAPIECLFQCGGARYCHIECGIGDCGETESSHMRVCGILFKIIRRYNFLQSFPTQDPMMPAPGPVQLWGSCVSDVNHSQLVLFSLCRQMADCIMECLGNGMLGDEDLACLYRWSDVQVQKAVWRKSAQDLQMYNYEDYENLIYNSPWSPDSYPVPILSSGPLSPHLPQVVEMVSTSREAPGAKPSNNPTEIQKPAQLENASNALQSSTLRSRTSISL
ncbi:hypothetical protein BJ165DRAFT_1605779 [Panaeolus papilionaceus]|nr:hypothetical protein BJ165DRAFT_1605779 [Panaeolus papilionaceus]